MPACSIALWRACEERFRENYSGPFLRLSHSLAVIRNGGAVYGGVVVRRSFSIIKKEPGISERGRVLYPLQLQQYPLSEVWLQAHLCL